MSRPSESYADRSATPRRRGSESGQILIVFVVVLTFIVGAVALMLDGGRVYWEKRMAQNAADAAAIAGGQELRRGNDLTTTEVVGWIKYDATLHKFTEDETTVYYPPVTGIHAGDTNFVEVVVERDVPLTFMHFFGWTTAKVRARATAGLQVGGEACIIALNNTAERDAFKVNGSAGLTADCGIMVNSTDPNAMRNVGTGTITASWVGVTGGYSGGATTVPTAQTGVPPVLDPLTELPIPNLSPGAGSSTTVAGVTTFSPGYFSNQIKITGGTNVFLPGEYILEKGIAVSGNSSVTGSEVFFYNINTNGKQEISFNSNDTVQLSAPTSGDYKGILFFNNRDSPYKTPGHKLGRGTLDSFFSGALYFPSQHLDWAGNPAGSNTWSLVIADTINVSGTADLQVVGRPSAGDAPPTYTAVLFE